MNPPVSGVRLVNGVRTYRRSINRSVQDPFTTCTVFTVPTATRRQQRRTATLADIKAAALRQLRDVGPAALSLRAVAAELEMSAGALYRYYDGRDGLLTELITDGFADLAAALTRVRDQHDGDDIADALFAVSMAYRRWAMQHPHEFALLYGTPIPDYAAPVDGPTSMASRSVGQVFIPLLIDGWRAGEADGQRVDRLAVAVNFVMEVRARRQA